MEIIYECMNCGEIITKYIKTYENTDFECEKCGSDLIGIKTLKFKRHKINNYNYEFFIKGDK